MRSKMRAAGLALALLPALAAPVLASDAVTAVANVNGWYASLMPGQAPDAMAARAGMLLAEDVVIDVRDLGFTQTRDEYLESLENWADAIEGGAIAHRIEPGHDATTVTATVCFRFESNEVLNRETFTLDDGLITGAVFEAIAEDCADF